MNLHNAVSLTSFLGGVENEGCVVSVLPFLLDVFKLLSELNCSVPDGTRSVSMAQKLDGFYEKSTEWLESNCRIFFFEMLRGYSGWPDE